MIREVSWTWVSIHVVYPLRCERGQWEKLSGRVKRMIRKKETATGSVKLLGGGTLTVIC